MFGDLVRAHRHRLGRTQAELAAEAGLGVRSVRGIEAGRIHRARPATVRLLADALELVGADRDQFLRAAAGEARTSGGPATARPKPAQLPPDLPHFAGRAGELARMTAIFDNAEHGPVVISALSGTAGVGKTVFAVHWAHAVAARFNDGQLYVNLRGFDHAMPVLDPSEAIRGFLDALAVPPERIPVGLDEQVGLYRSLLAGKRILVLLDNARDVEQVRPLLPGSPEAFVVVTSRDQLLPLVAAGAHSMTLDVLPQAEARELLARRIGSDRVESEPRAVEAIVTACAGLPLALAIAAARSQTTGFPLSAVASELGEADARLDALGAGSVTANVRRVFSWSYATLDRDTARLFRLQGLHPGPDISAAAAASAAGEESARVGRMLNELTRANLLIERAPDRYTFHDLLRAYARDLAHRTEPENARRAATIRMLDHYVHTAYAAERLLHPLRDPMRIALAHPSEGTRPVPLADYAAAVDWLSAEHAILSAALRLAADTGRDTHVWQLAWAMDSFCLRQGHRTERVATWRAAVRAAHHLGDPAGAAAYAHRLLANSLAAVGQRAQARKEYERALALHTDVADSLGQADTYFGTAQQFRRDGDLGRAMAYTLRALELYRAAGNRRGQAIAHNQIGYYNVLRGDPHRALTFCQQAVALHERNGDRVGAAHSWDSLGYAHHHCGDHDAAVTCYEQGLALFLILGDLQKQAEILTHLGDAHHAAGRPDAAGDAWGTALAIFTDLDHPEAAAMRTKLERTDRTANRGRPVSPPADPDADADA